MKIQHFAIIFIIIILPFSIICRSKMASYGMTLKDQVRLNNVIDVATQDALDMLVELNDEFQMLYINERFDITQQLAEEAVKSFFKTMAINFNMPYTSGDAESYFSMYVPAIVIVAYDGFFIYSVDENPTGTDVYRMSPKIPYAYFDEATGSIVHFTLGNYIRLFTNNMFYEGELTCNYSDEVQTKYQEYVDGFGSSPDPNIIAELTSDMSIIIEALGSSLVPDFLQPGPSGAVPLLRDYDGKSDLEASDFHRIRRETIIKIISDTLKEEINEHTSYASMFGSTYQFGLPDIARDDWMNSINDISVMSFIQGMPIGVSEYYDNYALSGSRITRTDYYYGTSDKYYHRETCPSIRAFIEGTGSADVENIFITREQAAENGYYPCADCHP